jgi:hypothetical protein
MTLNKNLMRSKESSERKLHWVNSWTWNKPIAITLLAMHPLSASNISLMSSLELISYFTASRRQRLS